MELIKNLLYKILLLFVFVYPFRHNSSFPGKGPAASLNKAWFQTLALSIKFGFQLLAPLVRLGFQPVFFFSGVYNTAMQPHGLIVPLSGFLAPSYLFNSCILLIHSTVQMGPKLGKFDHSFRPWPVQSLLRLWSLFWIHFTVNQASM